MKQAILLGAATVVVFTLIGHDARAQMFASPGSWYLGLEGGWTDLPNGTFSGTGAAGTESYDDGYNVGGRAGYMAGPWRFEGEFSYRRNSLRSSTLTSPIVLPASPGGDRHTYAEMFNVLYDFNMGWVVTPHIGGGIGVAEQTQTGTFPAPKTASTRPTPISPIRASPAFAGWPRRTSRSTSTTAISRRTIRASPRIAA